MVKSRGDVHLARTGRRQAEPVSRAGVEATQAPLNSS
jgi:hypothetical protein